MSQPKLSIIVPAYNVQGYVGECLDSVLEQSFTDFEVICVDDCTPDASGEIMDEYAARDPRIRVLHLEQNVGLGRARNAGMAKATGQYLFFLDSDDTITPGSLQAIADRLEAVQNPDILIFDYARTFWWGKVKRNFLAPVFRSGVPDVFTIDEQPQFLEFMMVVWNKVYRRDFVERHGFEFPEGYYEDTPWTFPTLMLAESVSSLDIVAVHYRQRRQGNILRTVSRKHFDIFTQYRKVWALIDSDPVLITRWQLWMFESMIWHFLSILHKKSRVPSNARREFFGEMSQMYRDHLPAAYEPPGGITGLKHKLIRRNSYYTFQTLKVSSELARRARILASTVARFGKMVFMRATQAVYAKLPLRKGLTIYSAYWHRNVSCNPAAMWQKAEELIPGHKGVWVVPADVAVPEGARRVKPRSFKYWRTVARASFLVNNVNFEDELIKRPGSVHIQTHHGTPLKTMGLSLIPYPTANKGMDFDLLLARCDKWDYSLSSNRHSALAWERAYPASYKNLNTGYPRNDRLINASVEDIRKIRADLGISENQTAILYAPTHRDYHHGYVPRIDFSRLLQRLDDDIVILLRAHYFYGGKRDSKLPDRLIDVSSYPVIEDLQLAADVLLTDYSSIMFDYANLNRPITIYADDWPDYQSLRGSYFDLMKEPPGLVLTQHDEIVPALNERRFANAESARHLAEFRERFCQFDDGQAAERAVRATMLGESVTDVPLIPLDRRLSAERVAWDQR